eukprot:7097857-Alexandrium_andersonii.AAC.1
MVVTAICRHHHHPMVLTTVMFLARRLTWAQTRSSELSRGPVCAAVRAEREDGNERPPGSSPRIA